MLYRLLRWWLCLVCRLFWCFWGCWLCFFGYWRWLYFLLLNWKCRSMVFWSDGWSRCGSRWYSFVSYGCRVGFCGSWRCREWCWVVGRFWWDWLLGFCVWNWDFDIFVLLFIWRFYRFFWEYDFFWIFCVFWWGFFCSYCYGIVGNRVWFCLWFVLLFFCLSCLFVVMGVR